MLIAWVSPGRPRFYDQAVQNLCQASDLNLADPRLPLPGEAAAVDATPQTNLQTNSRDLPSLSLKIGGQLLLRVSFAVEERIRRRREFIAG